MGTQTKCVVGVAVFLPGFFIGTCSSLLALYLWAVPEAIHSPQEREILRPADNYFFLVEDDSRPSLQRRRVLRRYDDAEACNETYLQSSAVADGSSYLLFVLIQSSPHSLEMRNAIRSTWLEKNYRQSDFVGRFIINSAGLSPEELSALACENKHHRDVVFLSSDHLEDESISTPLSNSLLVLQALMWSLKNVDFSYLLKCTDSTFAITEEILTILRARENSKDRLLWGYFAGGVEATKEGHLAEKDWFLCTHYLPYPEGGGYVISHELISQLEGVRNDLQHYTHDDIAIGVWFAPFSGIERWHDVRFNTGHYSRGCNNVYIVTHGETANSMKKKFLAVSQGRNLCDKEFASRPSYYYNWTVPAHRCCVKDANIP